MSRKQITKISTLDLCLLVLGFTLLFAGDAAASKANRSPVLRDQARCRACLSEASALFAAGELSRAASVLSETASSCPRNAQLHLLFSTVLIRQGLTEQSEREAALACAAEPGSQACHLQYAMTLMSGQKWAQSASAFEQVIDINPASYEAWSSLADLYKRLRRDEDSERAALKAASLEPGTLAVKLAVLKNLKKSGRFAEAKNELEKLLKTGPLSPEFAQDLALEALKLGAYDESIAAGLEASKAYPKSEGPLKCVLFSEFLKGQYAQSESRAQELLSMRPQCAEALAVKGICELMLGADAAQGDIARAESFDPSSGFVSLASGLLKMRRGDFEGAGDCFKRAGESDSRSSMADGVPQSLAHLALCRLYRTQGLFDESRGEARAAAGDIRFKPSALGLEALSILGESKGPEAVESATKLSDRALSLDPENQDALIASSFCELRAGMIKDAALIAENIGKISPSSSEQFLLLAELAEQRGEPSVQKEELSRGLKAFPNDPELLYELGRLFLKDNKASEAVPLLKRAADMQMRGASVCLALAEAFEKCGATEESLKYYRRSLTQGLSGEDLRSAQEAQRRLEGVK